ncbi:ribonuclease III [Cerasicoccus arenae]|uniref:Ribonuclease 3 n=1 Tax=Cerasicoccus arenae TaxID=424488 RepID=A0A8J3DBX6_9BACT|nr:ribonuclease III [Cerasicoccus arenae]MBK1857920.1 ribonuclease III [Cerasicoccus arenae]GHC00744.1 ribonuclease 3 [Cerasicoccus arenae]
MTDTASLEQRIGHCFRNPSLLEQALTHSSRLQDNPDAADNQRLEFLGDAVLGLVLAEALYSAFPDEREGYLARARSVLAKGEFLAQLARELELPSHILMSDAERAQEGHLRDAALEDSLEALIGAIYLDTDYPTTRDCLLGWFGDIPARLQRRLTQDNPKGRLQEWSQANGMAQPDYTIVDEAGPGHAKEFHAEVAIAGVPQGAGMGTSKKEAEEAAARVAITKLGV